MSKRRDIMYDFPGDLPGGKPDDAHWAVYTRKKEDGPARWAGYLDAVDVTLALQYAREHYGQDEVCTGILIHRHEALADSEYGVDPIAGGDASGDDGEAWTVFAQRRRGMIHIEAGTVRAPDAATAVARARSKFANGKVSNIRVVREADCYQTTPDELAIWRNHDMSYKLARGYSKDVRAKWAQFRSRSDDDRYASEDIKDHY